MSAPKIVPSNRSEQLAALRAMSAAGRPAELSIVFSSWGSKPKPRRYFDSDESFAEHYRRAAIIKAAECTVEWEYPVPVESWTGSDLDAVIAHVTDMLDELPSFPEDVAEIRHWHPGLRRGEARSVSLKRTTRGRKHLYTHNYLVVRAVFSPFTARIELPAPIPSEALAFIIEWHGKARFEVKLDSNLPYVPMGRGGAR